MTLQLGLLPVLAAIFAVASFLVPGFVGDGSGQATALGPALLISGTVLLVLSLLGLLRRWGWPLLVLVMAALAWTVDTLLGSIDASALKVGPAFWLQLIAAWLVAWQLAERLTEIRDTKWSGRVTKVLIPAIFGASILVAWEAITRGAGVPRVLLPPPSIIWSVLTASVPTLAVDFVQTFKAVLVGYILGNGIAFMVAIAVDRSPFLKRGLLPLGSFVSALPLIGIAPIMVMWFGFDWPSKAAVVIVMTFFPMLVNTVAGLNASSGIERDMMRTYASSYWQTLFKLRLPAAAPFVFNALKINSTLALIGAIVAEFFGTPIVGMGFRISSEIGKLNVPMVWAEIAVAALAGSVFYWVVALIERAVTFWHPSVRGGRT
jgi:NitT/TauT family transport system permease protein